MPERWSHAPSNVIGDDPKRRRRVLCDGREVGKVEQIGNRWEWEYREPGQPSAGGSAPDLATALQCVRGRWQAIRNDEKTRREAWERGERPPGYVKPTPAPPPIRKKRSRNWHLKYLDDDGNPKD